MNKVLLGSAVALVAVAAIAATATMTLTDNTIDNAIEQLAVSANGQFTVDVLKDDNRLTNRQLNLALHISQADTPVTVIVENTIKKTPWGSTIAHSVRLDDFAANAQIDADDPVMQIIRANFIDQAFVTGQTNVNLFGQYETHWQSNEVSESVDEVTFQVKALDVIAQGNITGNVTMTGEWPGLTVSTEDLQSVEMTFLPLTFSAEGEYTQGGLFVGTQQLNGQGFSLTSESEWDNVDVQVSPFEIMSVGDVEGADLDGSLTFSVADIRFTDQETVVSLADLSANVSVVGVDVNNYQALVRELNKMQITGVPSPALMTQGNALLQHGFEFRFDDGHAQINDSQVNLSLSLTVPENTVVDLNNPLTLMGLIAELSARLDLSIDASIMQIDALYEPMMSLLTTGALINSGDQYSLNFRMEGGIPELNGEPLPLPF